MGELKRRALTARQVCLAAACMLLLAGCGTPSLQVTLVHDDGTSEFGFRAGESVMGAVRFSAPQRVLLTRLLFYVWGETEWVRVYVLDSAQQPLYSDDVHFSGGAGWHDVDISSAAVHAHGDFYVGWMWVDEHPCPPCSWLGVDTSGVPQYRSYLGSVGGLELTRDVPADTGGVRQENYMIRVVVTEVP